MKVLVVAKSGVTTLDMVCLVKNSLIVFVVKDAPRSIVTVKEEIILIRDHNAFRVVKQAMKKMVRYALRFPEDIIFLINQI
jgi:hypothetical protein